MSTCEHRPTRKRTTTDLVLFFAGTFALSWSLWGAALLTGIAAALHAARPREPVA